MISSKAGKTLTEDIAEAFKTWYEYVSRDPSILCKQYNLSPDVCKEVMRIRENPCLDHHKAEIILREFFTNELKKLGVEPSEELFRDALEEIKSIIPKVKCVDWQSVLASQVSLDRWIKRVAEKIEPLRPRPTAVRPEKEEKKVVEEEKLPVATVRKRLSELSSNIRRASPTKFKTLDDLIKYLRDFYTSKRYQVNILEAPAELVSDAVFIYIDPEPYCETYSARGKTILYECENKTVMIVARDNIVYLVRL
ncbi:MAG: hypothetical protein C0179_02005 [Fervidicoccus sp.]|nr:MAG: hypothetical protein C0179_02005 [Fervidicoccus sp.]